MPVPLGVGDIIRINAPDSPNLEGAFIVKFLSSTRIVVMATDGIVLDLPIDQANGLAPAGVSSIALLHKAEHAGFARQNGLLPGEKIRILLEGDESVIGRVKALQEDQIHVVLSSGEEVYVDFGYRGIDPDSSIVRIDIIDDEAEVGDQKKEEMINSADIQFGVELPPVSVLVEVPENEKRYGVARQELDFLNELLSQVPTVDRNHTTMARIQKMVEAFGRLRTEFSEFNTSGMVEGTAQVDERPLVQVLSELDTNIGWVLPLSSNIKKVYLGEKASEDANYYTDVEDESQFNLIRDAMAIQERKTAGSDSDNSFDRTQKEMASLWETSYPSAGATFIRKVGTDLGTVVGNSADEFSTVFGGGSLMQKRFFSDTYTSEDTLLKTVRLPGGEKKTESYVSVPAQDIGLKGFVILPKPVMEYSRSSLLSSSLLTKANYSSFPFMFSSVLNDELMMRTVTDRRIKLFKSKVVANFPSNYSSYPDYLRILIPTVGTIASDYSFQDLTLGQSIAELAPLGISIVNVDAASQSLIAEGVRGRLDAWVKALAASRQSNIEKVELHKLARITPDQPFKFSGQNEKNFKSLYGPSFSFTEALALDNANVIFTSLSIETAHLATPSVLVEDVEPIPCDQGETAKRYASIEELRADGERPPRYDRGLDPTYYENRAIYQDIIDGTDDAEKKLIKVAEQLTERTGMNSNKAKQEASALILGYRPVVEGDYALVGSLSESRIMKFQWNGHEWVGHRDTPEGPVDRTCSIRENCLVFNKQCISTEGASSAIARKVVDKHAPGLLAVGKQEREVNRQQAVARLPVLLQLQQIARHKKSVTNRELGSTAVLPEPMESPNLGVLNRILGQGDFALRMLNVARFSSAFTRAGLEGEPPFWRYCNTTGVRLLPSFLTTLAEAFTNDENYGESLAKIVASQGTIADDGEAIVDTATGWEITRISFSADEGFDDLGFAIKSREVLTKDISSPGSVPPLARDPQARTALAIINTLSELTSVPLEEDRELLLNEIGLLVDRTMPTRAEYAAALQKAKGKKDETYENLIDQAIILYASAYFLLFAQTALFMPRPRRSFPGCQRTFKGYPSGPITETDGIQYISCILASLRTKERPWGSIIKMKEKSIAKKLVKLIERYISTTAVAQERILRKGEAVVQDTVAITVEGTARWQTFLPPRFTGSPSLLADIPDLRGQLGSALKSGSPLQFLVIGSLRHQIMKASIDIGLDVKDVVESNVQTDRFVLTTSSGVPYLENACCSSTATSTSLFLLDKKPNILKYNSYARSAQEVLDEAIARSTAPQIFDPTDTRLIYPSLPLGASKETIIRAFVVYCAENSQLYDTSDLLSICSTISGNPLVTTEDAIATLSGDSLAYDVDKLNKLMSVVNTARLVHIDVSAAYDDRTEGVRTDLARSNLDEELKNMLTAALDDPTAPDKREKVLDKLSELTQAGIAQYNGLCASYLRPKENSAQQNCLELLFPGFSVQSVLVEEAKTHDWNLRQNLIRSYGVIFPNIVANSCGFVQDPSIPNHWELSLVHANDVRKMLKQTYSEFAQFYDSPALAQALTLSIARNTVLAELAYNIAPGLGSQDGIPSLFDDRMVDKMLDYILVRTMQNTLEAANNDASPQDSDRPLNALSDQPEVLSVDQELLLGTNVSLLEEACKCSALFLDTLCTTYKAVEVDYEEISGKALRGREKEKDLIVEYLTDMSDEAREVENLFKNHSLGRWSVGMQKGFKSYDKDMYDVERLEMDELAVKERQEGKTDMVTAMLEGLYPEISAEDTISQNILQGMNEYKGEDDNVNDEDFDSEL